MLRRCSPTKIPQWSVMLNRCLPTRYLNGPWCWIEAHSTRYLNGPWCWIDAHTTRYLYLRMHSIENSYWLPVDIMCSRWCCQRYSPLPWEWLKALKLVFSNVLWTSCHKLTRGNFTSFSGAVWTVAKWPERTNDDVLRRSNRGPDSAWGLQGLLLLCLIFL